MARKKKAAGLLPSQHYRRKIYVGVRSDGTKRYESFTAPSAAEADLLAAAFRLRVRQLRREGVAVDDITREGEAAHRTETVRHYLDLYIESCEAAGLSPATLRGYRSVSFGVLEQKKVTTLTVGDIQQYVNRLAKERSPKTIRNHISLLFSAIRAARPDLRSDLVKIPARDRPEMQIPTTEDVQRMILASKDTPLYVPLLLAAIMGLRRSEICGLLWKDVDLKARTLTVRSASVRGTGGYVTKGTKTRAGTRTLPIPQKVAAALASSRGLDPRVTALTPAAITCRFERLMRSLGLEYRLHDLRHYHASMMIAVGAPDKYITADMGHATMDMVHRVYGHVMRDRQTQINEQMEQQADRLQI